MGGDGGGGVGGEEEEGVHGSKQTIKQRVIRQFVLGWGSGPRAKLGQTVKHRYRKGKRANR